jgi:hypothetical protein
MENRLPLNHRVDRWLSLAKNAAAFFSISPPPQVQQLQVPWQPALPTYGLAQGFLLPLF